MLQQHSVCHIALVGFTEAETEAYCGNLRDKVVLKVYEDAHSFAHPRHKTAYELFSGIIFRINSQDAFLRKCSAVYFLRRMGYWMPVVMMSTLPYDGLAELGDSGVIVSLQSNECDMLDRLGEMIRVIISLNKSLVRSGVSDTQQHREYHDLEQIGDDGTCKCLGCFSNNGMNSCCRDGTFPKCATYITQNDLELIRVLSAGNVLKVASKQLHMSIRNLQIRRAELFSRFEVSSTTALVCKLILLVRAASQSELRGKQRCPDTFVSPPPTHTHTHTTTPDRHIPIATLVTLVTRTTDSTTFCKFKREHKLRRALHLLLNRIFRNVLELIMVDNWLLVRFRKIARE